MPMDIYQDEVTEPPRRGRRVAFAAGSRGPLTPHHKNNVRSKTPKDSTKNGSQKAASSQTSTTMQGEGKENGPPGSLRRQLRATMTSPLSNMNTNKENVVSSKAAATTSFSNTATMPDRSKVLTPSLRQNLTGTSLSKPVKTPKSLLKREMEFLDAEESFLISPGAPFSLVTEDGIAGVETSTRLISPFEAVKSSSQHHEKVVQPPAEVAPKKVETTVEASAQPEAVGRAEKRVALRQKRLQGANASIESQKVTGTTPYRKRGNGVQMDLSSMFTELASPEEQVKTFDDKLLSPVEESPAPITASVPVASLNNLQESIYLDFGDENMNSVGTTRSLTFMLEAPAGYACQVDVERVPFKKGFDLVVDDGSASNVTTHPPSSEPKPTTLHFNGGEQVPINVLWTPVEAGGVREVILLKLPRGRMCITVRGKARIAKQAKVGGDRKVSSLQ